MAQKTRHGLAVSTLFSAISLLYGTAAYGGWYPGHIDPGGNGFDIPGFHGDAVFGIPDGCLPGGSFTGWERRAWTAPFVPRPEGRGLPRRWACATARSRSSTGIRG